MIFPTIRLRRLVEFFRGKRDPMVRRHPTDRHGSWMQTSTGVSFYPLDPRVEEINITDIAHGLSHVCRYGGHCRRFYSVAEHAVLVSLMVPERFAMEALLHDSSEAYIGDMIRPIKHSPEMRVFRTAESRIEACVFTAFGVKQTPESHRAVKAVDDRILVDEINALMPNPSAYLARMADVQPLGIPIAGWPSWLAKANFLDRYCEILRASAGIHR